MSDKLDPVAAFQQQVAANIKGIGEDTDFDGMGGDPSS